MDRIIDIEKEIEKDLDDSKKVLHNDLLEEKSTMYLRKIRVYNDLRTGRKLVDYQTALSIGLVSLYDTMASKKSFFVISDGKIKELEKNGYEIEYVELQREHEYAYEFVDFSDNNKNEIDKDDKNKRIIDELKELRNQIIDEDIKEYDNSRKL